MTAPAKRRRQQRPEGGPVALAAAILAGSADLSGARCTEYVAEFDPDIRAEDLGFEDEAARWSVCQLVCRSCPARARCWQWAEGLSGHRKPAGPLATTVANPFPVIQAQRARHQHTEPAPQLPAEAVPPPDPPSTPTRSRSARRRIRPSINRSRRQHR